MRVYALVPAAGRGTRFGGPKLLAKLQDRELLGHVLVKLGGARAAGLISGVVVMHRPDDDAVRDLATEYRAYPVPVRDPDGELAQTIQTGIDVIVRRGPAHPPEALMICLADQPLLRLDVIQALVDAWGTGRSPAVRPAYRDSPGEPGHPLLLDRSLWHLASDMRGDSGFAPVLQGRRITVRTVSVGGKNPDVDTPEDLHDLAESAEAPKDPPGLAESAEAPIG